MTHFRVKEFGDEEYFIVQFRICFIWLNYSNKIWSKDTAISLAKYADKKHNTSLKSKNIWYSGD